MPANNYLSLIFIFIPLSLVDPIHALAIDIQDPKNILENLPAYGARKKFEKAFVCNQAQDFFIKAGNCKVSCEFAVCIEDCKNANIQAGQMQVEECGNNPIKLYSNFGLDLTIDRLSYQSSSNSIVKSMIESTLQIYDHFEYFEVSSSTYPLARVLIQNGQLKRFATAVITANAYPNRLSPDSTFVEVEIDPFLNGLDQLMCVSVGNGCSGSDSSSYIFKRKGLKHGYQ